jgi:methanogenic corrinoid protein MtbC1
MISALVAFDERAAEQIWKEACDRYSKEDICTEMLIPIQIGVGEGWHRGEISVASEHFASRFVQGKLINLLNTATDSTTGPLAVVGCAQGELHELGAIMVALFMRWSGIRVIFLGQNVPNTTIEDMIRDLRPQVLALSATTAEGAHHLIETGHIIARIEAPRPLFIYGGMAFYERSDLHARIQGQFLEGDVRAVIRDIAAKIREK